uniref:Uncharacterized protein n=1 Tax=Anguilla anguilla TaxID=7936 RepID=A0A0E9WR20_ANGAN
MNLNMVLYFKSIYSAQLSLPVTFKLENTQHFKPGEEGLWLHYHDLASSFSLCEEILPYICVDSHAV